jgi:hypothetical protein
MEVFGFAALFGLILGFMFGVGCAFAVLYTIYMGGYRKAIAESLREPKPIRYLEIAEKVKVKILSQKIGL